MAWDYQISMLGLHPSSIALLKHVQGQEGEVEATFKAIRGDGDERVAVIELNFDIEVNVDITQQVADMYGQDPTGQGVEIEIEVE